ncbi:MAG: methyltransferase [Streptosporangiaceae bacterium]
MPEPYDDPGAVLLQLVNGYQTTQAIHVAVRLGLGDRLGGEPRPLEDVASEAGVDRDALCRLLRALSTVGVFEETEPGHFRSTAMSELLRRDHPRSVAGWPAFVGCDYHWASWGDLHGAVTTGENAMVRRYGEDVWQYRATRPEETEIFNAAMSALSRRAAAAIAAAYDFSQFPLIADIGGADGSLLAHILSAHPRPRGIVFDLPHVVAGAGAVLEAADLQARCATMGGSYLDAVPADADAYLIKSVLMDHSDEECRHVLGNIRSVMNSASKLLVIEQVVESGTSERAAAFSDLNMLVTTGGRLRSRKQWVELITSAGLVVHRVIATASPFRIIEATGMAKG